MVVGAVPPLVRRCRRWMRSGGAVLILLLCFVIGMPPRRPWYADTLREADRKAAALRDTWPARLALLTHEKQMKREVGAFSLPKGSLMPTIILCGGGGDGGGGSGGGDEGDDFYGGPTRTGNANLGAIHVFLALTLASIEAAEKAHSIPRRYSRTVGLPIPPRPRGESRCVRLVVRAEN